MTDGAPLLDDADVADALAAASVTGGAVMDLAVVVQPDGRRV
ncbi:hypothetical protein [Cellulomonas sp.]|nr:hypothetical protein [Cellulomonas sp.]